MPQDRADAGVRRALLGAAFLMATSAIGPGFLTQTAVFTEQLGASNPETDAAKRITVGSVKVASDAKNEKGQRELKAKVEKHDVELTMDADGKMVKAKCGCSFFFGGGLRKGPCRHLQALRTRVTNPSGMPRDLTAWYEQYFRGWN